MKPYTNTPSSGRDGRSMRNAVSRSRPFIAPPRRSRPAREAPRRPGAVGSPAPGLLPPGSLPYAGLCGQLRGAGGGLLRVTRAHEAVHDGGELAHERLVRDRAVSERADLDVLLVVLRGGTAVRVVERQVAGEPRRDRALERVEGVLALAGTAQH